MINALVPFLKVAEGIPDNWPDECILRFEQRTDKSLCLSYYGVYDATGGITIGQFRGLQRWFRGMQKKVALVELKKGATFGTAAATAALPVEDVKRLAQAKWPERYASLVEPEPTNAN